jgi:response regulator RpfG family c-di-GMP phosphodiesterase
MPGREMRNFFNFLKSHTDPAEDSAFVQKLKNLVDESNQKEDVRKRKMTLEYEINEAAQERAEKMALGIAEKLTAERLETAVDNRLFETARTLLRADVPLSLIAQSTGLSLEQVERIKESLSN